MKTPLRLAALAFVAVLSLSASVQAAAPARKDGPPPDQGRWKMVLNRVIKQGKYAPAAPNEKHGTWTIRINYTHPDSHYLSMEIQASGDRVDNKNKVRDVTFMSSIRATAAKPEVRYKNWRLITTGKGEVFAAVTGDTVKDAAGKLKLLPETQTELQGDDPAVQKHFAEVLKYWFDDDDEEDEDY